MLDKCRKKMFLNIKRSQTIKIIFETYLSDLVMFGSYNYSRSSTSFQREHLFSSLHHFIFSNILFCPAVECLHTNSRYKCSIILYLHPDEWKQTMLKKQRQPLSSENNKYMHPKKEHQKLLCFI